MKDFYKNLPIIKYLFLIIGILLASSGVFGLITSTTTLSAFICTILGAIFIAGAIFYDGFVNSPKTSTRVLRYIVVLGTFAWLFVCFCMFLYGNSGRPTYTEDVLIVVGCGSNSSAKPTKILERRLDKAVDYLKTNPYAYVVVAGGREGGNVTETDVMAIYLQQHGIDSSRIIRNSSSKNMLDRFKQTKKLIDSRIDGEYRCVTITSFAQALRSQFMARRCGIRTAIVGVRTDFMNVPTSYMHELLAIARFAVWGY